jgi:hypothetical protein
LDDSGKDQQNRITTVAGFVAREELWAEFERVVEPIFAKYGVNVLHAMHLHQTTDPFKGWSVLKKQAFVARICGAMKSRISLGVSMSVLKGTYKTRAAESGRKRTVTPYTYCFNVILDWLLRDILIGKDINAEGLSFILESGHEHNPDAERTFHEVRKAHGIEQIVRSISFVGKTNSRAIQMADLIAFYSRRHGGVLEKAQRDNPKTMHKTPIDPMMRIINECVRLRTFVATDFGPKIGSPFLRESLELSQIPGPSPLAIRPHRPPAQRR